MSSIAGSDFRVYAKTESVEGVAETGAYDAVTQLAKIKIGYQTNPVFVQQSGTNQLAAQGSKSAVNPSLIIAGSVMPDFQAWYVENGTSDTSFTLVISDTDHFYTMTGCKIKSCKFSVGVKRVPPVLTFEMRIEGISLSTSQPDPADYGDFDEGGTTDASDVVFYIDDGIVNYNTLTLVIETALDFDYDNSGVRSAIRSGMVTHTGNVDIVSDATGTDFEYLSQFIARSVIVATTGLSFIVEGTMLNEVRDSILNEKILTRYLSWVNGFADTTQVPVILATNNALNLPRTVVIFQEIFDEVVLASNPPTNLEVSFEEAWDI